MPLITTPKALRPRTAWDAYPTPPALARAACARCLRPLRGATPAILDPGAGTGVWGAAARLLWPTAQIAGIDADPAHTAPPAYSSWVTADFLTLPPAAPYALILGNPPYRDAEAFVRASLAALAPGGQLLLLLRLEFLASRKRGRGLWATAPPRTVWVCVSRPSFTGDGKTDATDYALFHWTRPAAGRPAARGAPALRWLDWQGSLAPAGADPV